MFNVLFTTICNRNCPYCFAKEIIQKPTNELREADLSYIIAFLKKSNFNIFNIIGGEPTLHSKFEQFIKKILESKFKINIFTNGVVKRPTVKFLSKIPDGELETLVNVSPEKSYSKNEYSMLNYFLKKLHKKSVLSFTIFSENQSLDFLIDYIVKYDLRKEIRIGTANPICLGSNLFLPIEKQSNIAKTLVEFCKKCDEKNIKVSLDCGFVYCAFNDNQLGKLISYGGAIIPYCNPVLDVSPNLDVYRCFATSKLSTKKLKEFKNLRDLFDAFKQEFSNYEKIGFKKECSLCNKLKRKQCCGGCISHKYHFIKNG